MTQRIPQSTAFLCVFKAYLASDHTTEATSKTIAITISKNGGAFGNPNAGATNATEISSGWYKVSLDTTDTGTTGPLAVRGAVATIDDVGVLLEVVSATSGGYTNLDAAITSRLAPTVAARTLDVSAGGEAGVDWANVGSPTTSLALTGTTIATTQKVDVDTIKTNPVVNSGTITFPTTATLASTTNITAGTIATVSGNVTGSVGSVTGLTASNLDTTVSSRLATLGYTAPDNTSVTSIKTQTDKLTFTVANQLDANVQYVNDIAVNGVGTAGNPWGP